jgi:hypothetical protein
MELKLKDEIILYFSTKNKEINLVLINFIYKIILMYINYIFLY